MSELPLKVNAVKISPFIERWKFVKYILRSNNQCNYYDRYKIQNFLCMHVKLLRYMNRLSKLICRTCRTYLQTLSRFDSIQNELYALIIGRHSYASCVEIVPSNSRKQKITLANGRTYSECYDL